MRPRFWLERWEENKIGFHQPSANALLVEHWPALGLPDGASVFVPLCGKSLDMRWLEDQGHRVIGVELAPKAADDYFDEAGEDPVRRHDDHFITLDGARTRIHVGDVFDLTAAHVSEATAVFDRAALVALPPDMRARYAAHLLDIVPVGTVILLLTFGYDQARVDGPPHAVLPEEIERLYRTRCTLEHVTTITADGVPPHFTEAGVDQVTETVHRLVKQS